MTSSLLRSPGWIDAVPIVGTAGHVDHGKSTLVLALTGRDPDRWAEEKRRGLTIDLGFAWTELSPGVAVGFVDVPGHERFIKNMLAGIEGIDVALLVVAADEGWMPQSEEHLAVIDLLDIAQGVVALTRTDLVDAETAELAALEIEEELAGTSLESAPIIPTAAPMGTGLDAVKEALAQSLRSLGDPYGDQRMRLWVDRSFPISGAGTVATGTLLGGSISVGDEVAVYPGTATGRVRALQSHERSHDRLEPRRRAAVNLVGIDRSDVPRGTMLGAPDQWRSTNRALVRLRMVRGAAEAIGDRGAYHAHIGSAAVATRLRVVDSTFDPYGTALLTLETRLPLSAGDRIILRDVGRRSVIAGGTVLDPAPPRTRREAGQAAGLLSDPGLDAEQRASRLLEVRGRARIDDLFAWTGAIPADRPAVDGEMFTRKATDGLVAGAESLVTEYHQANPLRPGRPKGDLAGSLGISIEQLDRLVVADSAALVDRGAFVRHKNHSADLTEEQERSWRAARELLRRDGHAVPRAAQLGLDDELLHALLRDESLIKVADDLVYLPDQVKAIEAIVAGLPDEFTVADFRDAAGVTRRHAVPLLEWFDRRGLTQRTGDRRTVRRPSPGGQ